MDSKEELQTGSGNTSLDSKDSKDSGRQKSMLELLSITDAAVKALNKSSRSQGSTSSQGSKKNDPLAQSTHSDHSVKSVHSDRSLKSDRSGYSNASQGSGRSQVSRQSDHSKTSQASRAPSHDSGVASKTHTISEQKTKQTVIDKTQGGVTLTGYPVPGNLQEENSDVSTTASDVLIKSTVERSYSGSVLENGVNGNSSISSKCSKTTYGAENFNSSGPQKVKISKKHLKEIKSPFEDDSPRDSVSSDGKVPSDLLGKPSSKSGGSSNGSLSGSKGLERKTSLQGSSRRSSANSDKGSTSGKSFPVGVGSEQFLVEKIRKPADNMNMANKKVSKPLEGKFPSTSTGASVSHGNDMKELSDDACLDRNLRSTPKYFVERHTPQKISSRVEYKDLPAKIPEKKNLLQDLEDSVEIVTANARDTSTGSSQPEIVTVPERIITISSKVSLSPSSSISDFPVTKTMEPTVSVHSVGRKLRDDKGENLSNTEKNLDDSNVIPPALARHFQTEESGKSAKLDGASEITTRTQWFSKQTTGHGLLQGAPVTGMEAPDKPRDVDIEISDFKLSEKQKLARQCFARRQGGPVRRVVQPHIVSHDSKASSTSSTGEQKPQSGLGQSNDQVLTAAAAASAAVAATQPFLKAQYEMEAKMAEVLNKMNELQQGGVSVERGPVGDSDRIRELERQVAEMTERRIEYMESLQAQQMAMQAKLLSMTREATHNSKMYYPREHSPETHVHIHRGPANKAFSKTTVSRSETKGDYSDNVHKYSALQDEESSSPLDTPAPRRSAPRPTIYDTSDIEFRSRAKSPKARSPKTKSPKAKSPKNGSPQPRFRSPKKEKQDSGILHQILASSLSPEPKYEPLREPTLQTRSYNVCDSPNVKKAKNLIDDLSVIKDQVKGLVAEKENQQMSVQGTEVQVPSKTDTTVSSQPPGPSPLDRYLKLPNGVPSSPYKSVPDISLSQLNAPVLQGFKDAESILREVQKSRGYLESNLETVLRGRQDAEVYNMLETLYHDSNQQERSHIQKMVDSKIVKLRREVEREITDDLVLSELNKAKATGVPGAVKVPAPVPAKPAGRYGYRGRLHDPKPVRVEPKAEPKKPALKRPGGVGGKENIPARTVRPSTKKTRNVFEDETYMTKVYGKAAYQKGRTTVKDPYLHFQNTSKHKAPRPVAAVDVSRGKEVMSSKTQTGPSAVKQFYFNPATGTYIPLAAVGAAQAPVPGQLIPMAVPLGGPRMDSGLTVPTEMSAMPGPVTLDPSQVSQVTAASNVAMVSMGTEEDKEARPTPELGKQVLPAVDIDTDLSEMSESVAEEEAPAVLTRSPERKPKKHVHIVSPRGSPNRTPAKAHYEEAMHEDDTNVEEEDVEAVTGIEFPGYQPREEPQEPYMGPEFPPRQPPTDRQLTSDLIAADIKRRDILQNNAMEWLEQELMARIITEVYPLKEAEPPTDISHVVSEVSEDSMAEDKEQSRFVMDTIGHRGMQLFVDVGRPVDNVLVQQLVNEVLQEKVRGMLGERPDREGQTPPPHQGEEPQWEEPSVSEEIEQPPVRAQQVQTPEPTPRASPASSPPRRVSPAPTPVASPPREPARQVQEAEVIEMPPPVVQPQQPVYMEPESEPESSASYDIKEELNRLADKLHPQVDTSASFQSHHNVATPPESPKPEPPPQETLRPLTPPELSPRPVVEDSMMIAQRAMQAGMAMRSPERTTSQMSSPKSPAHVSEEVEEEEIEQPKPVIFTVAETQTDIHEARKSRSPSPARDKSRSRTPSESSYTESSSVSDTFNENVSEGQWLINKSDGEVADFPIDEDAVRERMLKAAHKNVNVSSASTWKDAEDVDLDEATDASRSEGEFLYNKAMFPPEKDPVLDLLSRLQNSSPQFGMYDMSHRQVTDVLNGTGRSEGEVIRMSVEQQQQPVRNMALSSSQNRKPARRTMSQEHQQHMPPQKRSHSPIARAQSPTRVSFEGDLNDRRSPSPTRGILKRSASPAREDPEIPVRDSGRSRTPTGRIAPGGRQPQGRGMISAGGRATSPLKSSMRKPPQLVRSSTLPESRSSGPRVVNVRASSEDNRESFEHTGPSYYGSTRGSRSMTPDQMNVDALIQSGYLSQSFSQSENGGKQTGQSSLKSSGDLRMSRTSAGTRSLGYSYGTEGSLTESELERLAREGTGKLQMSLTIPGSEGFEESDMSEIDITDGGK